MSDFASEIKRMRSKEGLTQEKFAQKIGYSRSYLRDIESGRTQPSRAFLEKLSLACGTIPAWAGFSFGVQVENIIRTKLPEQFIYVFGFKESDLIDAVEQLRDHFGKDKFVEVDISSTKSYAQILRDITGKSGTVSNLHSAYVELTSDPALILTLRGLSSARIKDDKGLILRSLFKESLVATLIVVDFPSLLEKNFDIISYYVIPFFYR